MVWLHFERGQSLSATWQDWLIFTDERHDHIRLWCGSQSAKHLHGGIEVEADKVLDSDMLRYVSLERGSFFLRPWDQSLVHVYSRMGWFDVQASARLLENSLFLRADVRRHFATRSQRSARRWSVQVTLYFYASGMILSNWMDHILISQCQSRKLRMPAQGKISDWSPQKADGIWSS